MYFDGGGMNTKEWNNDVASCKETLGSGVQTCNLWEGRGDG